MWNNSSDCQVNVVVHQMHMSLADDDLDLTILTMVDERCFLFAVIAVWSHRQVDHTIEKTIMTTVIVKQRRLGSGPRPPLMPPYHVVIKCIYSC